MTINGRDIIDAFKQKHADARKPLHAWLRLVSQGTWGSFSELRKTFDRKVDRVREGGVEYTVFDIKGNKYRVITEINYLGQVVVVDCALTHAEYSKERWKR